MLADILTNKKLILISGKGGVGKTTVSSAVALFLSRRGVKTLLAEIDSQGQVAALFKSKATTYTPQTIRPNLDVINITPTDSFKEYVLLQIKLKAIYSMVFDNKYVRNFVEGAPGLAELMTIGKVYASIDDYDTIVMDAPATGHGMSLLQVPSIVSQAVPIGPLRTHSDGIQKLLADSTKTLIGLVTLAEEMPVAETIEMQEWIKDNLRVDLGVVFVNALYPALSKNPKEEAALRSFLVKSAATESILSGVKDSYKMRQARRELQGGYVTFLQDKLPKIPQASLPYLFAERFSEEELLRLGESLASS